MGIIDDDGEFLPGADCLKASRNGNESLKSHFYYADVYVLGKTNGSGAQGIVNIKKPHHLQGKFHSAVTTAKQKAHPVAVDFYIFGAHQRFLVLYAVSYGAAFCVAQHKRAGFIVNVYGGGSVGRRYRKKPRFGVAVIVDVLMKIQMILRQIRKRRHRKINARDTI